MINAYPDEFADIRPFTDQELPAAIQRIIHHPDFPKVAQYVYPGVPLEEVKSRLAAFSNIHDFQVSLMFDAIMGILKNSVTDFTYSGVELLDAHTPYLFISNHRDIALDAFLHQLSLYYSGRESCQITFGENLMQHPLITDLGKCNKMFKVERSGSLMAFYKSMALVSKYMRFVLSQGESVWIAQRNGRTKDGLDTTESALVKMFALSGKDDALSNICSLNLAPVSISYEWEPCDTLKAIELSRTVDGKYQKAPGEDVRSILTGILQPKGRVHIATCQPITRLDYQSFDPARDGDIYKWTAALIDSRIRHNYRLWPNNYIAYDLLHHSHTYQSHYTAAEQNAFEAFIQKFKANPDCTPEALQILLGIYANPVTVCQ